MKNNFYQDKKGRYPLKTVTIESTDSAVFDYFDKKLNVNVTVDEKLEKVNVIFAAGERWALIRKNKFRDENGTLILPIISIRRTDIDRDNFLGGFASIQPYMVISNIIHPKTNTIQNAIDARKRRGIFYQPSKPPVIETLTIPTPDFCIVNYEITIWTQYSVHMNQILEKIFYNYENAGGRVDSFVMPLEYDGNKPKGNSFYFVGFRNGFLSKTSNESNFTDQEKVNKYVYNIKVPTYFILDPDDEALSYGQDENGEKVVYKKQSINTIKLKEEVLSFEEFDKLYGKKVSLK